MLWRHIKQIPNVCLGVHFVYLLVHFYGLAERTHGFMTSIWWRQPTLFSSARFVSAISNRSTMYNRQYWGQLEKSQQSCSWLLTPSDLSIVVIPCGSGMCSRRQTGETFPGAPSDKKRLALYQRQKNLIKCYNLCFSRCQK